MNRCRRIFIPLLFALASVGPARALDWDKTQIAATPARGDEVVRATYEFKNSATKPVHILGVTTSCSCTEATPSTSEVKPGASGTLDVLFTIGKRTGLQEKEITVLTDDAKVPIKLQLKVTLPTDTTAAPPKKS